MVKTLGNELWTPIRVKNFMRELKMKATKWEENIAALAEKGSMSVEEFLATDPITFGNKVFGISSFSVLNFKLLDASTYRDMMVYYNRAAAEEDDDASWRLRMDASRAVADNEWYTHETPEQVWREKVDALWPPKCASMATEEVKNHLVFNPEEDEEMETG